MPDDQRRLLTNFISLTLLQGVNFILPLLTFPYLVRVLGTEKFGLVMFAQSFCMYFNILTDFGFSLSATREISIFRHDKNKIIEIFNSVMIIKIFLMIISFAIMSTIIFFFKKFSQDALVYFYTFGIVVGQTFFPIWFFQGMEKMRYITVVNVVAKSVFTISIFVFIRESSDYVYVPLLNALGYIVAAFISFWIVFRYFKIKIKLQKFDSLINYFKDSSQFFLSRVAVSIYTSSNAFVLGLFTNNIAVGYYSIAEKIYQAIQQVYMPIVNALYPYVAKEKNVILFKKIFLGVCLCNVLVLFVCLLASHSLICFVAGKYIDQSSHLLKIFLVVAMIVVPSIMIGYPFLAAFGHKNYANSSVVCGSVFHLVALSILVLFNYIGIYQVVIVLFFTELIVFSIRIYGVRKFGLWSQR
jgi:PST family polysaccharide transporter